MTHTEAADLILRASGSKLARRRQLKDDGRFPAVQILQKHEFSRFITACENPKQASDKLKHSIRSGK